MSSWRALDRRLILASQSPRRREILARMGLVFEVAQPDVENEEEFLSASSLVESLKTLARAKAQSVAAHHPDALVLGADTVVVCGDRIMGKPRTSEDAADMLRALAGRVHHVHTAVALVCRECGLDCSNSAVTAVYFGSIDEDELRAYLALGEHADKAGAYAIQGAAMQFIDKIEGCYYNVVGLPVTVTINLLREFAARKERGYGRHA